MRQKRSKKRVAGRLLTGFLFIFFFAENSFALVTHQVKNVVFETLDDRERAVIQLDHLPEISWFALENPDRIAVNMKDTILPEVSCQKTASGKLIRSIRIGQNTKTVVRAVLDLTSVAPGEFRVEKGMRNGRSVLYLTVFPPKALPADHQIENKQVPSLMDSPGPLQEIANLSSGQGIPNENSDRKIAVLLDDDLPEGLFETHAPASKGNHFHVSGMIQARTAFQIQKHASVENNTKFRNRMILEAGFKDSAALSVLSDYLFFGSENETDDHAIELHEAKWRYRNKNFDLSMGKQILRWGKTDQFSPVDTLNPEDGREFILPDYEERKIPVWMADIRLFFDRLSIEGVVVPFFEPARFDYFQTDWSVFGHMKKEILAASVPQSFQSYFSNLRIQEQRPANETEWGLRLTQTIEAVDLGFTFHHTTQDHPHFTDFPVKNIATNGDFSTDTLMKDLASAVFTDEAIQVEYRRTNIAGISFETILSGFGVRGEAAWQENESFLTASLISVQSPTLTSILGADYTFDTNTYLNLQFAHRHISQYDPAILYFDRDTCSFLGELRMDLISDWLKAGIEFTWTLTDKSSYLNPYIQYTYIPGLECRAGAGLFSGDRDTWFGRYRDKDLFYLDIAYRF